jgi:uncharacterized protein
MKTKAKILAGLGMVAIAAAAGLAIAQTSSLIPAALADGVVGEQADGYLGFRGPASGALKAEVDALNIKRRAVYTGLAEQRGVTIKDVAVATGCETLAKRVVTGRAYMMPDGVWRVKGATAIALPGYCAS